MFLHGKSSICSWDNQNVLGSGLEAANPKQLSVDSYLQQMISRQPGSVIFWKATRIFH